MRPKEIICCVYKITSPSGKIYIGQTGDFYDRMRRYKNLHCKGQKHLYYSLRKYGFINHRMEVLQQAPENELDALEINYIWRFNTTNRELGMNLNLGGKKGKTSEETRLLMRKNSPHNKPIYVEKDGTKTWFPSSAEACRHLKSSKRSAYLSLRSEDRRIRGYKYSWS